MKIALLYVSFLGFVGLLGLLTVFKVKYIDCQLLSSQQSVNCPPEVLAELEKLKTGTLFNDFHRQISQNTELKTYAISDITKRFPSSVLIQLTQSQDAIHITSSTGSQYFVRHDRVVVEDTQPNSNTSIVLATNQSLVSGMQLDEATYYSLSVLHESLSRFTKPYEKVEVLDATTFKVSLPNGLTALGDITQPESSLYKLTILLDNLTIDEIDTDIKELDVRYQLPVLRTTLSTT